MHICSTRGKRVNIEISPSWIWKKMHVFPQQITSTYLFTTVFKIIQLELCPIISPPFTIHHFPNGSCHASSDYSHTTHMAWHTINLGSHLIIPRTDFINNLQARDQDLVKIHITHSWKIIIRLGHNFAHVTTAHLSWHVLNCDLKGSLESKLMQKVFQLVTVMSPYIIQSMKSLDDIV